MKNLHTPFCALVGCELPIVQAPLGSTTSVELVAAVCEAGGLGMLAGTWLDPAQLAVAIAGVRAATARPLGVNLVRRIAREAEATLEALA